MEKGLNSMKEELEEVQTVLDQKADKTAVEALEDELEELRNRSRRNNLVFYNILEKAEEGDCINFIQQFIAQHMGLETLCGQVELEQAHRTPTGATNAKVKRPRPIHVAFLQYTDKMEVLASAAVRLKDNPFRGNIIGISEYFAKVTQDKRKQLLLYKKFLQGKLGSDSKVYIAYPAVLKFVHDQGRHKSIQGKDLAKLKEQMQQSINGNDGVGAAKN